MTRLRGWGPTRERVVDRVPHGHWQTSTLIAALGVEGVRGSTVVDGPVNAGVFTAFVEQVLAPTLKPDDVVVMDNLSSHKGVAIGRAIQSRGAELLYLPPYSPDLSPIEPAFGKIKQTLRSRGWRTLDELWAGLQGVLDLITTEDAEGFFRHCGYPIRMEEK